MAESSGSDHEQSWSDEPVGHGRIFAVSDNPISRALEQLAGIAGRRLTVVAEVTALEDLRYAQLGPEDAVVICDHDIRELDSIVALVLGGPCGYLAVLSSRRRADATLAELATRCDPAALDRLHTPAGLNLGGKAPGEIALSVLAEIVAHGYGRTGGPMRA
jgi:xanthine/CO dehydrogenase XdhC/CoxF family maturation factor